MSKTATRTCRDKRAKGNVYTSRNRAKTAAKRMRQRHGKEIQLPLRRLQAVACGRRQMGSAATGKGDATND